MQDPKEEHMDAAKHVLCYMKGNLGQGLFMKSDSDLQIVAYCDSDWGACAITRRSLIGYFVTLGGLAIS